MAQISDPQKLFEHELGMALGAERKVLTTLRKLEQSAQRPELKQQFHHHLEETDRGIAGLIEYDAATFDGDDRARRAKIDRYRISNQFF